MVNLSGEKKVLFFSKSSDYEHDGIKPAIPGGQHGFAFEVLSKLAKENNIEFTFSKDGSLFTPEYLTQFDALCFYTSGDLDEQGTDGNPSMTPEGKAAFLKAISNGKGFVGIHSATDTFHSPGSEKMFAPARYHNDGKKASPYIQMLGGEFIMHNDQQSGQLIFPDHQFPGFSILPDDFGPTEEWYSLKNFAPDLHVLIVQKTDGMQGELYDRPNYPSTWAHLYGEGRVFYTSMGHREDIWKNPMFQSILAGGLNWALKRVDADISPNINQVTPKADVLPPEHSK